MKHTATALALAATSVLMSFPALAREKAGTTAPPAVYQAVVDCRTIAESAQRLACFDRTVGAMATATTQQDLVILDRETMRETRKGLFGFSLPKLKLFGGGSDDVDERDQIKEVDSTITGIRGAKDGFPIFTLEDGAKWKQTDGRDVYPKTGQKIKIKRAAMGSFMASVDGHAGVRVMRLPE